MDKPLGLSLEQSKAAGGGARVKSVSGNAAKAGIKPGDTIILTSSFFGDELWPADKVSFTQSAINVRAGAETVSSIWRRECMMQGMVCSDRMVLLVLDRGLHLHPPPMGPN